MNYFVTDHIDATQMHAGPKARTDAEAIMGKLGYRALTLPQATKQGSTATKSRAYRDKYANWDNEQEPGLIVFQYPIPDVLPNIASLPAHFARHRTVALVHDLDSVRFPNGGMNNVRAIMADRLLLPRFDWYISHNAAMTSLLVERGIPGEKIVNLGVFDYRLSGAATLVETKPYELVIAGTLDTDKCGYLLGLPETVRHTPVRLYGIADEHLPAAPNIDYVGAFPPDELVGALRGSFGLVWDGTSATTCEGRFGKYLRYNNPHKLSLYLAAGLPVITWSKAAIAPFVKTRGLGILVDSLAQIDDALAALDPQTYATFVANVAAEGERIRNGEYLRKALATIETRSQCC